MLAEKVANGELPPVEERLPLEPAVIRPWEIGQYGGELRVFANWVTGEIAEEPFELHQSWNYRLTLFGKLAKGWELAEDGRSLTIFLREGMKWSDGAPLTAEDFRFWLEDGQQNVGLRFEVSSAWKPGGELMGLNVIDDYTVQYTFSIPYWNAVEVFRDTKNGRLFEPSHFMKRYHPKFNPDVEALAAEEGFETWQEAYNFHSHGYYRGSPVPGTAAWMLVEHSAAVNKWERNPYYWRIDTEGNQLPYADTIFEILTEDIRTVGPIKVMAGEIDYGREGLTLQDYAVLKQHEEDGDYKVYLWPQRKLDTSTAVGFAFNYTHQDLVLREIFNDIRFRQACSLAIDRAEISKSVYSGLTEPYTASFLPIWPGYEDWMGTNYAEYDVDQANALLDEMGLEWDDAHEYRLRPDGKTLFILGEWTWNQYDIEDVLDLITFYWKEIGIQFEPKYVPRDALRAAGFANETTMLISSSNKGDEVRRARALSPPRLEPPWHWTSERMSSVPWREWHETDGESGIEPPENVKHLMELVDEWMLTPFQDPDHEDKYNSLINEILTLNAENMWFFGTVSAPPDPWIVHNRIGGAAGPDGPEWGRHHFYDSLLFIRK